MENRITYCLIGASGFVAPRHMEAIKKTGGELLAACDIHDSVGILDKYFPKSEFFPSESEFRSFCKLNKPDYTIICSPNYLHKSQSIFAMENGSTVICEKPVVLHPEELEDLVDVELTTGKRIFTILQLRLNPVLQGLKCEIEQSSNYYESSISYVTPRGKWYAKSWKGDPNKSGGLIFNIGIHLMDLMLLLFGPIKDIQLRTKTDTEVSGDLYFEKAHTSFYLSIEGVEQNRSLKIGNREIEFSQGFGDAHTLSYSKIISGNGFGLDIARPSIKICEVIRNKRI
jgi:UDP-N-acetyl-2-amino-2-deoxyglucuronate dehydrogenase